MLAHRLRRPRLVLTHQAGIADDVDRHIAASFLVSPMVSFRPGLLGVKINLVEHLTLRPWHARELTRVDIIKPRSQLGNT